MPLHIKKLKIISTSLFHCSHQLRKFRKTGAMLSVSESAIGRRIRGLEDLLGASLFERPERGHIKIGLFSFLAAGFLFDLLQAFTKEHPNVSIEFIEGDPAEHVAAIRGLQLDVALVTGKTDWIDCEVEYLWSERIFIVLPSKHTLANRDQIWWEDLEGENLIVSDTVLSKEIRDLLVNRLSNLRLSPIIHPQHVGRDNLFSLVASGYGVTVVSEITPPPVSGVIRRPITGKCFPVAPSGLPDMIIPLAGAFSVSRARWLDLARILFSLRECAFRPGKTSVIGNEMHLHRNHESTGIRQQFVKLISEKIGIDDGPGANLLAVQA